MLIGKAAQAQIAGIQDKTIARLADEFEKEQCSLSSSLIS